LPDDLKERPSGVTNNGVVMSGFTPDRKEATPHTAAHQAAVQTQVERADAGDFERATRGLIAPITQRAITGRFAHDVWNLDHYAFMEDPAVATTPPATANPSLWRQGRLNNIAGLFTVASGIYQVRGIDISNVTFVAGETGWIVIDPLTSTETASAAMALVNEHLGERPVHAVIYSHSHTDHYGGVRGIIADEDVSSGRTQVIAPAGFMEEVVSENVIAGTPMLRRATYMYGVLLPKDAQGHIDTGLGKGLPALPVVSLIAPTHDVTATGEEMVIDGVRIVFQLTPGTEAPSEMNMFFPDLRALCMAENCTSVQHNLYTLRGAQVRDALSWSKYIEESKQLYAHQSDVVFASHHWPRWGQEEITYYLDSQRDSYRYIHDQTMRLANHGLTANEIAEELELPESLSDDFFNHDYYGTVSHNAKAVYQRYLGWFDANPAHLHPLPPVEGAARYVEFMGGAEAVLAKAKQSFDQGDYRWVAEVVNHVVFADPTNEQARYLQADALEQLGYQAESGPWRDFYLTGASELRSNGSMLAGIPGNGLGAGIMNSLTPELLFDLLGVRLNGPNAKDFSLEAVVNFSDVREVWSFGVQNGVLHASEGRNGARVDFEVTTTAPVFASFAAGAKTATELMSEEGLRVTGTIELFAAFEHLLDVFQFGFEIVLP